MVSCHVLASDTSYIDVRLKIKIFIGQTSQGIINLSLIHTPISTFASNGQKHFHIKIVMGYNVWNTMFLIEILIHATNACQ